MMTDQLRTGVASAPLAAIDRRALSQAWYSALGFARQRSQGVATAPPLPSPNESRVPATWPVSSPAQLRRAVPPAVRLVVSSKEAPKAEATFDRPGPRARLAREIAKVFAQPRRPVQATFSLGRGGARVHVVLQSRGDRLRLVALCSPAYRTVAARALAQASLALAARGVVLTLEPGGAPACS